MKSATLRVGVLRGMILVFALFLSGIPSQTAAIPTVAAEIGHLLTYLERAGCQFNRNGTWYPASKARAHLEMKYRHLADQEAITTMEDFIDQAATASSMSGKIYQVKCEGTEQVPSAAWLKTELQRLRQASAVR